MESQAELVWLSAILILVPPSGLTAAQCAALEESVLVGLLLLGVWELRILGC